MKNINLLHNLKLHFIGICGISMSSLALIFSKLGCKISGSDISLNSNSISPSLLKQFQDNNITCFPTHNKDNIIGVDIVIYNMAIKDDNIELAYAKKTGIKTLSRTELLAILCSQFKNVIAIAGSHGKSTTTAILTDIFESAHLDFSYHIGGIKKVDNSAFKLSNSYDYFITEACEYQRSFLSLKPTHTAILNIDFDHPDCYKDKHDSNSAFQQFANNSTKCIICTQTTATTLNIANAITVGDNGTYQAKNINLSDGQIIFRLIEKDICLGLITLNNSCLHDVDNALFAIALARQFNISYYAIQYGLENYKGLKRRRENIFDYANNKVITDYAHHPNEINAIANDMTMTNRKTVCIFEPHTYSRTKALMKEFQTALKKFDKTIIFKTFPAREQYDEYGDYILLAKNINCPCFEFEESLYEYLTTLELQGYTIIFMGAGKIDKIAKGFEIYIKSFLK